MQLYPWSNFLYNSNFIFVQIAVFFGKNFTFKPLTKVYQYGII